MRCGGLPGARRRSTTSWPTCWRAHTFWTRCAWGILRAPSGRSRLKPRSRPTRWTLVSFTQPSPARRGRTGALDGRGAYDYAWLAHCRAAWMVRRSMAGLHPARRPRGNETQGRGCRCRLGISAPGRDWRCSQRWPTLAFPRAVVETHGAHHRCGATSRPGRAQGFQDGRCG